MSIMEEYVVDTNLATFILDGELWGREPALLMKELLAAYRQAKEEIEKVPLFYKPLETPQIVLPLTVQTELSVSLQVSVNT